MSTPEATALIQQISDLMQQYLSLPEETPLKATFSQVLPEVQAAAGGGGGDEGAMPPGMDPSMMGGTPAQGGGPLDNQDIAEEAGPEEPPTDYPSARKGALKSLQGAKASDEEEQRRKKKSS